MSKSHYTIYLQPDTETLHTIIITIVKKIFVNHYSDEMNRSYLQVTADIKCSTKAKHDNKIIVLCNNYKHTESGITTFS